MSVLRDTALTPNNKGALLNEIQSEISERRNAANRDFVGADGTVPSSATPGIVSSATDSILGTLQGWLDALVNKKGIITPAETNAALDAVEQSKKDRLKKDYIFGVAKTTVYLVGGVALVIGLYIYFKTKKK